MGKISREKLVGERLNEVPHYDQEPSNKGNHSGRWDEFLIEHRPLAQSNRTDLRLRTTKDDAARFIRHSMGKGHA